MKSRSTTRVRPPGIAWAVGHQILLPWLLASAGLGSAISAIRWPHMTDGPLPAVGRQSNPTWRPMPESSRARHDLSLSARRRRRTLLAHRWDSHAGIASGVATSSGDVTREGSTVTGGRQSVAVAMRSTLDAETAKGVVRRDGGARRTTRLPVYR